MFCRQSSKILRPDNLFARTQCDVDTYTPLAEPLRPFHTNWRCSFDVFPIGNALMIISISREYRKHDLLDDLLRTY